MDLLSFLYIICTSLDTILLDYYVQSITWSFRLGYVENHKQYNILLPRVYQWLCTWLYNIRVYSIQIVVNRSIYVGGRFKWNIFW